MAKSAEKISNLPAAFGPYDLLHLVGRGGMAEVFLARRRPESDPLAIKCIRRDLSSKRVYRQMFLREGQLALQLNHSAIVRTLEVGSVDELQYMCMEYIPGVDLTVLLRRALSSRARRLPMPHAVFIAMRVCEGLNHAHELVDEDGTPLNVVNRDVSPSNIRISFDGRVKLLDFGIAKSSSVLSSEIGVLKGKLSHMSPEQARSLPLDRRSDIFSTGIVLHELLTGEKLFHGESQFAKIERVIRAEVPPPSVRNPRVPAELDAVVMRALQRDPNDRYQSAAEMAEALGPIVGRFRFERKELQELVRDLCRAEWQKDEGLRATFWGDATSQSEDEVGREQRWDMPEVSVEVGGSDAGGDAAGGVAPQKRPAWMLGLLALAVLLFGAAMYVVVRG